MTEAQLIWQRSPLPERCRSCNCIIRPWKLYVRASVNQDSPDELGMNLCKKCATATGNLPEEL